MDKMALNKILSVASGTLVRDNEMRGTVASIASMVQEVDALADECK